LWLTCIKCPLGIKDGKQIKTGRLINFRKATLLVAKIPSPSEISEILKNVNSVSSRAGLLL
jgi:hypothetical protein